MADVRLMNNRYRRRELFETEQALVAIQRSRHKRTCPEHVHEFEELVIVTGGSGTHAVAQQHFPIQQGDVFVVAREQPHRFTQPCDLELINICFDKDLLDSTVNTDLGQCAGYHVLFNLEPALTGGAPYDSRLRLTPMQMRRALEWVTIMDEENEQNREGCHTLRHAVFLQLVVYLSRIYRKVEDEGNGAVWKLAEVLSYLEQHYADAITVAEMAEIAHLSERQFHRLFKESLGRSPLDHVLRLRLDAACRLLLNTRLSITQIALQTGFKDGSYFSKQFNKRLEISPRDFRKQLGRLPRDLHNGPEESSAPSS